MKPLFQFIILFALVFLIFSSQGACGPGQAFDNISGKCINCSSELGNNYAPSKDKTRCIKCECYGCEANENTTYECKSNNGTVYDKLVSGYYSDEYLLYKIDNFNKTKKMPEIDLTCIGGYIDSNYECKCDDGYELNPEDNVCYKSSYVITPIQQMKYSFLENDSKYKSSPLFDSYLFKQYSNQAIAGCQDNIPEKCQMLANLCALRMYDQTSAECSKFLSIQDTYSDLDTTLRPGWKDKMPWLFYNFTSTDSSAETYIRNKERLNFKMTFADDDSGGINTLDFIMIKYRLDGSLASISPLNDEFIQCSHKEKDQTDYRKFGRNIVNDCFIDITKFISKEMYFYEIFYYDSVNNDYIDIPILIDNIENAQGKPSKKIKRSDTEIHNMNNETDMSNWILTRRMFLFDNQSGKNGNELQYITYAKTIKLVVEMIKGSEDEIYVPYFEVFYTTVEKPENDDAQLIGYTSFSSEYFTDISHFMNVILGLFIAINVIVVIIVIYRMYVWYKVNPKELAPTNYWLYFFGTCFFKLCKFWGIFNFWFLFIISAYWYFFYKLQYKVYLLLPPMSQYDKYYKKFDILFGVACGVYMIFMFYRIACQVSFDVFFVDWEHDKEIFSNILATTELDFELKAKYLKYRGAWRLLHVANQFNALQSKRAVSIYFTFMWVLLLYYRAGKYGWWIRELSYPRINEEVDNSPSNYLLRHFLVSVIVLGVGAIEFVIVRLFQLWIPLKKTEFLDLCSVANISIFILDEMLHGYYIHGQSPFGKADSNLDELLRFLEEEGKGKIRGRGVSEGQEDLQCYEIYLSYKMRMTYDGLYYLQTEAMLAQNRKEDKMANKRRISEIIHFLESKGIELKKFNNYMNSQLKNKIENISSNNQAYIKEKNFLERILSYPPSNINFTDDKTQDMLLFKDPNANFDDVLFSGMEWDWFIMDVFLLQMWMIALKNIEIGFFLTFLCDQILYFIRVFLGEKNVSKKAVIDNRFFS